MYVNDGDGLMSCSYVRSIVRSSILFVRSFFRFYLFVHFVRLFVRSFLFVCLFVRSFVLRAFPLSGHLFIPCSFRERLDFSLPPSSVFFSRVHATLQRFVRPSVGSSNFTFSISLSCF